MNDDLATGDSGCVALCAFCRRSLLPADLSSNLEPTSICGDCKFLFFEDFESPVHEEYTANLRSRRRRFSSNCSFENLFLQHSTQMTSYSNQIQAAGSEHDNESVDGNASTLVVQSSSRTTPSGSRRWRSFSHSENEMYDSDSSVSFGVCSVFQHGSDIITHGVHVWDSDVSLDDTSFIENEIFPQPDGLRYLESDTDIDPMNAGFYCWDSDDPEEVDDAADFVWEGMNPVNDTSAASGFQTQLHRSSLDSNVTPDSGQILYRQVEGGHIPSVYANNELSELQNYNPIPRDSNGTRGFDELIEILAGIDDSIIGAPPAAASFVETLPQIIIGEDHEKLNDLGCAICKDSFLEDTVVNQLPCLHLYHSYCILPWLSTRNSCPLCRYELPTDDQDYEDKKQQERSILLAMDIVNEQDTIEENDSLAVNDAGADFQLSGLECDTVVNVNVSSSQGGTRGRRFFLVAAPIVGIASIVLMFCFGNSVRHRRWK